MVERIKLAYIGATGDIDAWKVFAGDIHGLQAVPADRGIKFRMDEKFWRIAIEPGEPRFSYLGLELETDESFEAAVQRVRDGGIEIAEDANLARARYVKRAARFVGPEGVVFELCYQLMDATSDFLSPTGARFRTAEHGMGHFAMLSSDLEGAKDFFQRVLGMRHTDSLYWREPDTRDNEPDRLGHFLRGSGRHHLLALLGVPGTGGMHHICLEVDRMVTVGRAWDKVEAGAAPIMMTIGQHANDPCLSYYCVSPSGFAFEYAWESVIVDDENWQPTTWLGRDLWGHHDGAGTKESLYDGKKAAVAGN